MANDSGSNIAVTRNCVWAISNLCRHEHRLADLSAIAVALPSLSKLMWHHDDDVVVDTLWTIAYIGEGSSDRIQRVASIDGGVFTSKAARYLSPSSHFIEAAAASARFFAQVAEFGSKNQILDFIFLNGVISNLALLLHEQHQKQSNPILTMIRKYIIKLVGHLLQHDDEEILQKLL